MSPVLDTNVLIDALKGEKDARNVFENHAEEVISITVINKYEFVRGLHSALGTGTKGDKYLRFIDRLKVYDFTSESVAFCSEVYSKLKAKGKPINEMDMIILGICLENKESIITNDVDFLDAGGIVGVRTEILRY